MMIMKLRLLLSAMWLGFTFSASAQSVLIKKIDQYTNSLSSDYGSITADRKAELNKLADKIVAEKMVSGKMTVVFSSNDNSSLSQLSQAWFQVALDQHSLSNINVVSCGVQENRISPETIYALKKAGFNIKSNIVAGSNKYLVNYSWSGNQMLMFSKKADNYQIPSQNVIVVDVDDATVNEKNVLEMSKTTAIEMMYLSEKISSSNLLSLH